MNDLRPGGTCSIPSKAKARLMRKISDIQFESIHHVRTLEHATMRPAAACESRLRQHRFDLGGIAYRLATATPAPPPTNVAPNHGYENRHFIQRFESPEPQTQNSVQLIHRQIASLQRRGCYRFAGLTPLTFLHYSCSEASYQTYDCVIATPYPRGSSTVTAPHNITKMPGNPRRRDSPPCVERCSIYTTRRFGNSIIPKYEHMFSIIDTNTCSIHRKAA